MKIRLASPITLDSIVDGPGLRAVLWTQGCNHNCKGCHNPQTHDILGGYEEDTGNINNEIRKLKLHRGITLSGGEPFLQSEALAEVAKTCKENNLDVWIYSGYTIEELLNKKNSSYFNNLNLLRNVDVLVDGRFIEAKRDISLKFRGSSNQRIIDVKKTLETKQVHLHEEYMKEDLSIAK
ncbi:anaerobic ribonucleoside-triphosphate reductase-activating protein [[Clostridium] sordellii]|uniref:Anaerobic ribonucleoside-triphosphate reductase-activating protein n=1 Tax=Paraclostridium sordellii TaxID=1505 RepID=A0ABP1XZN1_PARSO|nr:anaerobic ribonucleoside-triphosphate reductase activating protein [Paeniclostridium sordellii]CEJ75392.1 Anaerobic ribonucleoside-triphosphate reductase-activating protein [[Clostridium] sordellii] [Paeniclostridium sordellii]CEN70157.1 anaerobic ribonucleoside-triphosphate reductase-activating protein [[Clostridium] sordellii] [Paeniclostridium sordellii]CEN73153.1 anaerobic ribonucleoside-triphosphate reductase-activating protein [[Clostridium] sordellii] [Paeniclostridium sordellii]CEO27